MMQTYRPKEKNIYATKFVNIQQLRDDLGSAFVREPEPQHSVGCPDPAGPVARVLNAQTLNWQELYAGDYVVKTPSGAYQVHNGQAFEAKYEHTVTRDQGFFPHRIGGDLTTPRAGDGVLINDPTHKTGSKRTMSHEESPRVGGLSGGSCRG